MSMTTPYAHYGTFHAMTPAQMWQAHVPHQQWPTENWEKPSIPPPSQKWKEEWCKREPDETKENDDWKERDSRDRDRDKRKTSKSKKKEKETKVEEEEKTLDLDTR